MDSISAGAAEFLDRLHGRLSDLRQAPTEVTVDWFPSVGSRVVLLGLGVWERELLQA